MVERGIRLDHVRDRELVRRLDPALHALTIPEVTERSRPNGLPIAITWSPTRAVSELPSGSDLSARDLTSTLKTATSVDGSTPTTLALIRSLLEKLT